MPDIFISHSSQDRALSQKIQVYLQTLNVSVFLAPFSIEAGAQWSQDIRAALKESRIVLFLASRVACQSPWVNQELGGALWSDKRIIPVIWDIAPEELPGWTKELQVADMRKGLDGLKPVLDLIGERLHFDKANESLFVFGGCMLLLFMLASKD